MVPVKAPFTLPFRLGHKSKWNKIARKYFGPERYTADQNSNKSREYVSVSSEDVSKTAENGYVIALRHRTWAEARSHLKW